MVSQEYRNVIFEPADPSRPAAVEIEFRGQKFSYFWSVICLEWIDIRMDLPVVHNEGKLCFNLDDEYFYDECNFDDAIPEGWLVEDLIAGLSGEQDEEDDDEEGDYSLDLG